MKPAARRTLIGVGALAALLLVALILVPILFGDRIVARAKVEVNRSVNARVNWRDAGLGLIRSFPNLALHFEDLSVVGVGPFEGDTLAVIPELRASLDLPSVVKSFLDRASEPVVVRTIELDQPRLALVALDDSTVNWDIMKKTADTAAAGRSMRVSLRHFGIDQGTLSFDNRPGKLQALVRGLDQTLSGDFSKEQADIETRASADSVVVRFAGVTYLDHARVDLTANALADMVKHVFTLREGTQLRVNELPLAISGTVASRNERLGLDLALRAARTDFKTILSLVPAVYAQDFESLRTSGAVTVAGEVKGEYGEQAFPAFSINATVNDGSFRYPDLPLPARDIALRLAVTNPGGSADRTVVNLQRLHVVVGKNPIDATLVLRTPLSDPDIDTRVKGTLDLADVRRTIKLDQVQELSGVITGDAAVRTRRSWVRQRQYDRIEARGTLNVRDLAVRATTLPQPLAIREASLALTPSHAEVRSFRGAIGSSDLEGSGRLSNLIGYALHDESLQGRASLTSTRFNLNEWRTDSAARDTAGRRVIPVPPRLDLTVDARVGELVYGKVTLTNARGRLLVKDQRLTLEDFTARALGGSLGFTGYYETTDPAKPTFDVGVSIQTLDIPSAFQSLVTVQRLAPVARYAEGTFSANVHLNGAMGQDMVPLFNALTGQGTLQTSELTIEGFPALEKVAQATKLSLLDDPTLRALRSQFEIRDGRFGMKPFTVELGPASLTVSGSNGFDQSLDYNLELRVPRALIGSEANQAIAGLVSRAANVGINLEQASEIPLAIQLGGTVTDPQVSIDLGEVVKTTAQAATQAVTDAARQRVSAEAQRLIAAAEAQAAKIRAEARTLSESVRRQGYARADSLEGRSDNPLARAAAGIAANRVRKEVDEQAERIIREANQRADALVADAQNKAGTSSP